MSDLISREAALKKMRNVLSNTSFIGMRSGMTYLTNCFNALLNAVKNAPAVDAEPVRHGRWVKANFSGFLVCSCCEDVFIDWLHDRKWNYCPNCGTRMDAKEE